MVSLTALPSHFHIILINKRLWAYMQEGLTIYHMEKFIQPSWKGHFLLLRIVHVD